MFISELKVVLQQFPDPLLNFEVQAVRHFRPFLHKCLVDGELLARLDPPLKLVKKPERIVAAIAAGYVKGEQSMRASRARADGGVGSQFAIEFKPTAVREPNLYGARDALLYVKVTHVLVNRWALCTSTSRCSLRQIAC
jgi:hypothetical protein